MTAVKSFEIYLSDLKSLESSYIVLDVHQSMKTTNLTPRISMHDYLLINNKENKEIFSPRAPDVDLYGTKQFSEPL